MMQWQKRSHPSQTVNGIQLKTTNSKFYQSLQTTATAADLQELARKVNERGKQYGMEVNVKKTKKMVASKKQPVLDANIMIDGASVEEVTSVVYLGHMVTDDGKSDKEIKRRIQIARNAYKNLSTILSSRDTSIETRRIVKCYIWVTLLHGSKTWTITKSIAKKLNTSEMWIYRRMLRKPWIAHKSNNEILTIINSKQLLLNIVRQRQVAYFGNIIRRDGLQGLLVEGKINGKRGRGRPRTLLMDNVKEWTH